MTNAEAVAELRQIASGTSRNDLVREGANWAIAWLKEQPELDILEIVTTDEGVELSYETNLVVSERRRQGVVCPRSGN